MLQTIITFKMARIAICSMRSTRSHVSSSLAPIAFLPPLTCRPIFLSAYHSQESEESPTARPASRQINLHEIGKKPSQNDNKNKKKHNNHSHKHHHNGTVAKDTGSSKEKKAKAKARDVQLRSDQMKGKALKDFAQKELQNMGLSPRPPPER